MSNTDGKVPEPDARSALRPIHEGRYVDFSVAGEGGMGIVYEARDTALNRNVAFKIVRPGRTRGDGKSPPDTPVKASPPKPGTDESKTFERLRSRFLQEAWVTGAMEHPM